MSDPHTYAGCTLDAQAALAAHDKEVAAAVRNEERYNTQLLAKTLHNALNHTLPFEECNIQFCAEYQGDFSHPNLQEQLRQRAIAQATAQMVEALERDHAQIKKLRDAIVKGGSIDEADLAACELFGEVALAAHRAGQDAVEPLCADCGHPRSDPSFHLEAPGTNWGAALHNFKAAADAETQKGESK